MGQRHPSSTNPTNPYTSYGMEEGVPMTMICHQLNYNAPEDVMFGEARVRAQSMAAEDFLTTWAQSRYSARIRRAWDVSPRTSRNAGSLPA